MPKYFENRFMAKGLISAATVLCMMLPVVAAQAADDKNVEKDRMLAAGDVMHESLYGNSGIPLDVLNKAECVIVLPSVKKAAFIVGATYGRGVMTCRGGASMNGPWSVPSFMQSSGGSFGLQAGGQATDYILLVMNDKGAKAVMNGKVKLGGDASIAAGPIGRTSEAATNGIMSAELLSYSHTQGVFAGLSLSGSSLGGDEDANANFYGKKLSATQIIVDKAVPMPVEAKKLIATLTAKSPHNTSKK